MCRQINTDVMHRANMIGGKEGGKERKGGRRKGKGERRKERKGRRDESRKKGSKVRREK